jgi:hypothetical protein
MPQNGRIMNYAGRTRPLLYLLLCCLALPLSARETSQRFGPYTMHYSVVNSSFLTPEVAKQYQLRRGKRYALLNLSLREHTGSNDLLGSARRMTLRGEAHDMMKPQTLKFIEIVEGDAIYYLAETRFINEEWRKFTVHFQPENSDETYTLEFRHQFYRDL